MDISKLICEIKKDKENFGILVNKFHPLIKKYIRILYKDEKEEIYAELVAALWEAVCSIVFYDDEGQVISYLTNALKNKYSELYRKSRKYYDHTIGIEECELEGKRSADNTFDDILIMDELQRIRDRLKGRKRQIYDLIFLKDYTDLEVAAKLGISRQYVHRIKKELVWMIKEEVLDIN